MTEISPKMLDIPDLHSHILPGIDDGSKDAGMSRLMLDEMAAQGIARLAATPHFYPDRDGIDLFLERRTLAVERLRTVYDPDRHPAIYLGAEVAYFHGISRSDQLDKLTVGGSRYILIEMPFSRWENSVIEEILAMQEDWNLQPIVAHIERYIFQQKHGVLPLLIGNGILIQSNAEFFLDPKTRKKALKMLERGEIHFLGSDCHNMQTRRPNLGDAVAVIADAGLSDALRELESAGQGLFSQMKAI